MSDRYSTQRATPVLNRAMRTLVIPPPENHIFVCRVYDGRPEEGGKLIREEMPKFELPKGWLEAFNHVPDDGICVDCGNGFERKTAMKRKVRCERCQKERSKQKRRELEQKRYWAKKEAVCA